jgi:hypothetical protein
MAKETDVILKAILLTVLQCKSVANVISSIESMMSAEDIAYVREKYKEIKDSNDTL